MSSSPTAWWPGLAAVQGFPPRAAGALRLAEPHVVFACSPPWGFPCRPPRTIAQPCAELSALVSLQEFHGFGGRVPGERTSVQRAAVVSASASVSAASRTEAPVLVTGGRSGLGLLRVGCGLLGVSPSLPGVPRFLLPKEPLVVISQDPSSLCGDRCDASFFVYNSVFSSSLSLFLGIVAKRLSLLFLILGKPPFHRLLRLCVRSGPC